MVLNYIFFVLVFISPFTMLASIIYAVRMGVLSRRYRSGRILFSIIVGQKAWALMLMVYICLVTLYPTAFPQESRAVIRVLFALYLVVQSITAVVMLRRLRSLGET